ncbi:allantoate permease [Grosmannia clavigera kw1407]|uniref:Allantoate permease n=1 Tax=Grosmannia clavigera (strain kw1407 / UAMH 11150) TaxID=655863 RepID=F0XJR6_GROCL|nr:allantoate permease [Grosmannia clavigera kw1407]EFX02385.1 allantoate permease [Grosmannia clavigera kw1407]
MADAIPDASPTAIGRRIVTKVDWHLVPTLFGTCLFFYMDKGILSSASVFGLEKDLHLVGQDYSWSSSVYYFGYLFWMGPSAWMCSRLPIAKYLTLNTLIWGLIVGLTAACTSFGGLAANRFFLGVAEAVVNPAFMYITSTWYTRDQVPKRTSLWFTGNSIGGLVAALFAYGVGHISHPLHPWRWMYIILGILTAIWAGCIFFLLPDSISRARFLTEDERQWAADRVVLAGTGRTEKAPWRWEQAVECLVDPKTWFIVAILFCVQLPSGGIQSFANIVIKSFGFSSLESTLLSIPSEVIAALSIAITGYFAGRYRNLHCLMIILSVIPVLVGGAMIYKRKHISKGAQLFAYFLIQTTFAPVPLLMSLIQTNYKGVTKKMTMTAIFYIVYCAGNIAGPQLFKSKEAPAYPTAFKAIMACPALVIALCIAFRIYLLSLNAKRVRVEGLEGSAGVSGAVAGGKVFEIGHKSSETDMALQQIELQAEDYDDVTDWKTLGFRYRY